MRVLLALLLLAPALPASADACRDRLVALVTGAALDGLPVEIEVTGEIAGHVTEARIAQVGWDHSLTTLIAPAGLPVLAWRGNRYNPDGHGGWFLVEAGPPPSPAARARGRATLAAALSDARCSTLSFEGQTFDAVEGDLRPGPPQPDSHQRFLLPPGGGVPVLQEITQEMRSGTLRITRAFQPAPDLILPLP